MDATRHTILEQARRGEPDAWDFLDRNYRSFIIGWCRKQGVSPEDADDLGQEVMTRILTRLPAFEHSGRPGAFRSWVRIICLNILRDHSRSARGSAQGVGGTDFQVLMNDLPEDTTLETEWDEAHDRHMLARLLETLEKEFEPSSLQAFRRLTGGDVSGAAVAAELGLSVGAVYTAKSRVMRRLRELAEELIDESILS